MNVHYDPMARFDGCPWREVSLDRNEHPIAWVEHKGINAQDGYFMVTSAELIREVMLNPSIFSSENGTTIVPVNQEEDVIGFIDPPKHRAHRSMFSSVFSRRSIDSLRELVQSAVHDRIDTLPPEGGQFDLMHEFAFPMAVRIIGRLLGVTPEMEKDFRRWATAIEEAVSGVNLEENLKIVEGLYAFAAEQAEIRRLSDSPPDDLITAIVEAEFEGERWTDSQIIHSIAFFLIAGNSTVSDGMTNVIYNIENHPSEKEKLLADPDNIVPAAVEEMLRFDGPINGLFREAKEDIEVGGLLIPKSYRVFCYFGAGSHDPENYSHRPDEFLLDRGDTSPAHFAFGWGIHLCIGSKLARLALQNATYALYKRLPNLRMEPDCEPIQKPGGIVRGWNNIVMQYDGPVAARDVLPADFPPKIT